MPLNFALMTQQPTRIDVTKEEDIVQIKSENNRHVSENNWRAKNKKKNTYCAPDLHQTINILTPTICMM